MIERWVQLAYLIAAALFILSLKWMNEVRTARLGNWAGAIGMAVAVVATLGKPEIHSFVWIGIALAAGAAIGTPMALLMPMTAVPQRTALSHAFGALAAGLVGTAEYYLRGSALGAGATAILCAEVLLGFLTFTGSLLAFGKLHEILPTRPVLYPGRHFVSFAVLGLAILLALLLTFGHGTHEILFGLFTVLALLFGALLVLPIGGADMPTVISILNAYAGLSASFMGFLLNNKLLILAGALDGSSGLILSIQMCKAMNRSFANVLFGAVGHAVETAAPHRDGRSLQGYTPQEASTIFEGARAVVIVPGYGMAAAQAQHVVKELTDRLTSRGVDVKFGIHPVAGRMPGHMNVLLAEADVSYEQLVEMEQINPLFPETDVAIIVGANDITNPAARTRPESPLYGMPILEVDRAKTILFIKRSLGAGFAGVDNDLFYLPKTMMVFGDAKKVLNELITAL